MVKQRMSVADVAAEVACLRQKIVGMRVANIYDINAKVRSAAVVLRAAGQGALQAPVGRPPARPACWPALCFSWPFHVAAVQPLLRHH